MLQVLLEEIQGRFYICLEPLGFGSIGVRSVFRRECSDLSVRFSISRDEVRELGVWNILVCVPVSDKDGRQFAVKMRLRRSLQAKISLCRTGASEIRENGVV